VECSGCNVGMIDDTVAVVVAAWNRRPALAAPQQEPTAWKVHTVAKGAHQWPHEKGPALFQKLGMAEGWMNERIDFDCYRDAWIEPLYTISPPPAAPTLNSETINAIMEQAQVFASSWSLVGGRFDFGNALQTAEQEKTNLRTLLSGVRP